MKSRHFFSNDIIIELNKTSLLFLLPKQTRQTFRLRELPFIESPEQLRDSIIMVKEKLRHIESTSQLECTL